MNSLEFEIKKIVNNDTIVNYTTYKLEWLSEWKYGRKHIIK